MNAITIPCLTPAKRRMKRPPRILATRHEHVMDMINDEDTLRISRVVLESSPVGRDDDLQALMLGWLARSGGYPVGSLFGSVV